MCDKWSYWFDYGILCAVSKWLLYTTIMSHMELPKIPLHKWCSDQTHNHRRLVIAGFDYERMGEGIMVPSQRLQWQLWSYVAQNKVRLKKQNSEIANKKMQKWKAKKRHGINLERERMDSLIHKKQKQSNNRNKQKFIMFAPLVRLYFRMVFTFCPVSSQFCAFCWEKTTTLASTPSLLDSARAVETACIHHFNSSFIQIRTQLGHYTPLHGSASGIL